MNRASLLAGLATEKFGQNLIYYNVIGSTNREAKTMIELSTLPVGTVLLAAQQTAGRGTDGNRWKSNNRDGLLLSVVVDYTLPKDALISFLPAIALSRVLKTHYNIAAHAKWPNDVLVNDKKIAGILCEGIVDKQLIIGIGINVNHEAFEDDIAKKATSLSLETGRKQSMEPLFQLLMLELEQLYYDTTIDLRKEWLKNTKMIGKKINATYRGEKIIVEVMGLSAEGHLQIRHQDGTEEAWVGRTGLDIETAY